MDSLIETDSPDSSVGNLLDSGSYEGYDSGSYEENSSENDLTNSDSTEAEDDLANLDSNGGTSEAEGDLTNSDRNGGTSEAENDLTNSDRNEGTSEAENDLTNSDRNGGTSEAENDFSNSDSNGGTSEAEGDLTDSGSHEQKFKADSLVNGPGSYEQTIKADSSVNDFTGSDSNTGTDALADDLNLSKGEKIDPREYHVLCCTPAAPVGTTGGVLDPQGVAILTSKITGIVVAERTLKCVTLFTSPGGERLVSFGTHQAPRGVAVDAEDNVLTTDCENNCIQKFTTDGEFLTVVGSQGHGPLRFNSIYGIAVNPSNGRVYVSDDGGSRVHILDSDLTYYGTFGEFGQGKGQFNHPQHLACDTSGNVYVADRENHRIQVFTAEGEFLRMFGRHCLTHPCGIAVDSTGRVFVSEVGKHRVSMFTSDGKIVTCSVMHVLESEEELYFPRGLAVDCKGLLHVCDSQKNRIVHLLFPS